MLRGMDDSKSLKQNLQDAAARRKRFEIEHEIALQMNERKCYFNEAGMLCKLNGSRSIFDDIDK